MHRADNKNYEMIKEEDEMGGGDGGGEARLVFKFKSEKGKNVGMRNGCFCKKKKERI
jgi:hypothetical protein